MGKEKAFLVLLISALALALAGCVNLNLNPQVEVPANLSVSNVSIVIQPPNASLPEASQNVSVTIAQAPDNLTVCVIGNQTPQSDGLFYGNFTFSGRNFSYHPQYYDGQSSLGDCHLFVVKGDGVGKIVSRSERVQLAEGVGSSVSLMLSGLALSKVQDDPTVDGWEFVVQDLIPVKSGAIGHELVIPQQKTISRRFEFRHYYGVWQGFKNFDVESVSIYETLPSDDAEVIADFSDLPTGASDVAITAKQPSPASGRVLYFSYEAFDPGNAQFGGMSSQAVVFLLQDFLGKRFIG